MRITWKNITTTIEKLATRNVGLKLVSVVFAFLLWLLVVNIEKPTQSRNFTATVSVKHPEALAAQGKYFTLPKGNTVTFRVTARRDIIESLSSGSFKATADMEQLEDEQRIPIEIKAKQFSDQVSISSKKHYLAVSVGNNSENSYMIEAKAAGEPAEGFEIGSVSMKPDLVYVEGPTEIVSKIVSSSVTYNAEGRTEDFVETAVPKFFDADGREVDMTPLTTSTPSVDIQVDVLVVQEVPITVETRGELSDGLALDSITTEPSVIRLKGQPEQLNSLTTLAIPSDVINLSEIQGDFDTTVDIQSYLPEGVSIVNGESTQVKILVSLFSEDSRNFKIRTSNLTVRFLTPGLSAKFRKKNVKVRIRGIETELEKLDASTITGSVDASGLGVGEHSVSVALDLDEGLDASTSTTNIVIEQD